MMGYGALAGLGWFGMVFGVVFWVALIALLVWGISRLTSARQPSVTDSAEEILRRRFAHGEISQAEYEQARKTLA